MSVENKAVTTHQLKKAYPVEAGRKQPKRFDSARNFTSRKNNLQAKRLNFSSEKSQAIEFLVGKINVDKPNGWVYTVVVSRELARRKQERGGKNEAIKKKIFWIQQVEI